MGQDIPRSPPADQRATGQRHPTSGQCSDRDVTADSAKDSGSSRSDTSDTCTPTDVSDDDACSVTDRANTVIIFDWDDTLLCTTSANRGEYTEKQLQELATAVASILNCASELGEVMIITNGKSTWVMDSATRYMPSLLPLLHKLTVLSSRARCESRHPGNPFAWKLVAFEELLVHERSFPDPAIGLNIIALGDQNPEIEAAHHVGRKLNGQSFVKTVKFREQPTVNDLLGQLAHVEAKLAGIVRKESSSYNMMACGTKPDDVSQASCWTVNTSVTLDYFSLSVDQPRSIASTLGLKDIWLAL